MSCREYPIAEVNFVLHAWSRKRLRPVIGRGVPTSGVTGLLKLFSMPMSTGESFIEFWIPSPTTNAARMTLDDPSFRLPDKLRPQPVASPDSSNWSASMSSHLIRRS